MVAWRNLFKKDIEGLMQVADAVLLGLPESSRVFAERVKLYPEGCLALEDTDGQICGYAISHPIRHHQPPALDTLLGEIASDANTYYIHDTAILPEFRGAGLAAECVHKLLEVASRLGFRVCRLVSIYGTESFWARFGFVNESVGGLLQDKLRATEWKLFICHD
ncbi:GNAT family N-acetyltransferase [Aspergillus stella-maris]|uniref:GNAT family N-acetyltransferase n=1 Tax=Aspergillus stella-maris TaxID=1810926 RepID=UPI003CCE2657